MPSSHLRVIKRKYGPLSTKDSIGEDGELDDFDDDKAPLCSDRSKGRGPFYKRLFLVLKSKIFKKAELGPRTVKLDGNAANVKLFPPNRIRNQKYHVTTFIFQVLYEQFRMFFNCYFLLVALSQFIPALQVGYLFTYIFPLAFVLCITLFKEGVDDYKRAMRDKEVNNQPYERLTVAGVVPIAAAEIRVGHFIILHCDQRVPADMILLRTSDKTGAVFIRTDQLDGETDWKMRRAVVTTQHLTSDEELFSMQNSAVFVDKPRREIDNFVGNYYLSESIELNAEEDSESQAADQIEALSLEQTLWANTVLCAGKAIGVVVYTGPHTRSAMNASIPSSKVGQVDLEINFLSKLLFGLSVLLALLMVCLKGGDIASARYQVALQTFVRFVILFSSIIPISLRVNLDMAKTVYSVFIARDAAMPNTIVRSSFIPEELGRVSYLLSDKTGTLTQNEMQLKRLHLGVAAFTLDAVDQIQEQLFRAFNITKSRGNAEVEIDADSEIQSAPMRSRDSGGFMKTAVHTKVQQCIMALALCHNVTPTETDGKITFQAASPDEIALVAFAAEIGIRLVERTLTSMALELPTKQVVAFDILHTFPFTSEAKRMGIIVRSRSTGIVTFFLKGADSVMSRIVRFTDWLEEECENLSREGLRTLVVAHRVISAEILARFDQRYNAAKKSIVDRAANMTAVLESLETDMEVLALTGVEDKLQTDVSSTLETLRNAGVKIWMLTGDKTETATSIAMSSKLVVRGQQMFQFRASDREEAVDQLNRCQKKIGACIVVDGSSLQLCIDHFPREFIEAACAAPAVVCCRCSPTQKATIVKLVKRYTGKRTCAIGDGGNDVAMIQAADVGVGIVGKEGKQASLAADFSVLQFSYLKRLLLWHGRNSYTRTAVVSQFIIHRGLIISIIQAVFSSMFFFATIAIYSGWLLVGYTTLYTMLPVFSLVLDTEVSTEMAFMYPELYKDLQKGRVLCLRTFLTWTFKSIYQGGIIMLLAMVLFEESLRNIVSISFTALILTELLMVALQVNTWHWLMVVAELFSVAAYACSLFTLPSYFDFDFISSPTFWGKAGAITLVSCLPVSIGKWIKRRCNPPAYDKLAE